MEFWVDVVEILLIIVIIFEYLIEYGKWLLLVCYDLYNFVIEFCFFL